MSDRDEPTRDDGDRIAPVIPLFGGADAGTPTTSADAGAAASGPQRRFPVRRVPSDRGGAAGENPRAGDATERETSGTDEWHTTWRGLGSEPGVRPAPRLQTVERDGVRFVELPADDASTGAAVHPAGGSQGEDEQVERAEARLLRSLGSRGLSVSEARGKLLRLDVPTEVADIVIERLEASGALDDAALAEQVVFQAATHRNEGRKAIAQSLTKRGIPRDVVDAVVAELPDDDYERALEFARGRARQLARYDDDTALRRLVGQLSRRGYGGLAMSVARRALDEQSGPSHRVRFE